MTKKHDEFGKSRHSGLSGIGCFCNVLKKKDSGQAGMTVLRYYRTFYESVKHSISVFLALLLSLLTGLLLSGCGYSVYSHSDLPFKEIQIGTIENKTLEPKLQDKLHAALTEEFMKIGIMVNPYADTKISAVIHKFDMTLLSEKKEIAIEYGVVINADFIVEDKDGRKKTLKNIDSPFIVSFTSSEDLATLLAEKDYAEWKALKDVAMRIIGALIYK